MRTRVWILDKLLGEATEDMSIRLSPEQEGASG